MFILSPFYTPKYRAGSERFFGRVVGGGEFYLRWRWGGHLIDHWLKKINKLLISSTDEVGWEFVLMLRYALPVSRDLQVQSQ
jgi:hypothetical protein